MHSISCLLSLPASLLLLLSSTLPGVESGPYSPYSLPAHVSPQLEDVARMQRAAAIQKRMEGDAPIGVKKMAADQGQMFFLEYWRFDGRDGEHDGGGTDVPRNASLLLEPLQPACLLHSDGQPSSNVIGRFAGGLLSKRDFSCPAGTFSCASIQRPNSCCANGLTCNIVGNTVLGDVGCCANAACSGEVASCQAGYTACPNDGGGCCIPGYKCAGVGCVLSSTATITVYPTVSALPPPSTTGAAPSVPMTTASPPPPPSTTTSSSPPPPPTTISSPPSTTSSPASTAVSSCDTGTCAPSSSSIALGAPVRPTSAVEATMTAASIAATVTGTVCPTGFYQCSAYYNAGACCQVGRDCGLTSCPPHVYSTALVSDGVTVVVGATAAVATVANDAGQAQGSCATGWYSCASQWGGGCCPAGYACGTASCSAAAGGASTTATGEVGKQTAAAAAAAGRARLGVWAIPVALGAGAAIWGGCN